MTLPTAKPTTMIWTNIRPQAPRFSRPEVNTFETDEAYVLELALPGWRKDDVTLEVGQQINQLIASAQVHETAGCWVVRVGGCDHHDL